ncbi:MAG: AlwI family type II restriction endonuclease, partial [Cetobacterium sp.]
SYELYREKLEKSEKLSEIYEFMDFDINILKDEIIRKYPSLREKDFEEEIKTLISDEKEQKFKKLIETKFKKENLVKLLKHLNEGNSKKLKEFGFDTSLPTILEYLIGISWYLISEKEGKIYNIFNLKLDSNLLPIRFASGGQADLIYKYSDGHDVLLEATMTQKDNQRKLELEPVPRHLGRYRMDVNDNAYTIFIAPNLDPNVLVNFRAMKELPYYNPSNLNKINGLKIIPLSLENLIYILNSNLHYSKLREDFEKYYQLEEKNGYVWFENTINIEYL